METSKKLTGDESNDLTLFAVDTPANPSVRLESEREQTTQDTFGHGSEMPLARYDRDTRSWKTSEDISLWGEQPLLESLPKSGMTRNGVLLQQQEWVPITEGSGSLSWPTPRNCTAMAATITPASVWDEKRFPNLETVVGRRMWPTPRASAAMANKMETSLKRVNKIGYKQRLEEAVAMSGDPSGRLNPMWVEWLMGFPIGWTDLEHSETL